ncbi:homoserine dehydrogenase [Sulfobacillus acidophilus TPY]|uniref:Homoserine dehydrogenase n=1 Tax=Sulfobacillus acidophilus (strain ATCC 700253 / DSM 10332 / NAL) TaxID=679936 RepID=G8TWQ8_SULAD|nr:homoserine dehydrogenase [Sulfobacillus acidophilus TPY]AEW06047.1 homoserine dehydrogenase [Sulfobacillus acidophilus DSM 10332]
MRIGLLGLGTVGQAVVELSHGHRDTEIIRAVVRHPERYTHLPVPVSQSVADVVENPSIDLVVEVMGGREPARSAILTALQTGKHVVTANKEVMAYHGPELLEEAHRRGRYLGFEASVGGGIPIVDPLARHLSTVPITRILGVINGTSNYLLHAMENGRSYQDALADAQARGFAEADPGADVDGLDAVRKLVLLTYLAGGPWVDPDRVPRVSLTTIPAALAVRLRRVGLGVRPVAWASQVHTDRPALWVTPMVFREPHGLLQLAGPDNAIWVTGAAGTFRLEGSGAGGLATATSIWADIRRAADGVVSWPAAPYRPETAVPDLPWLAVGIDPEYPVGRRLGSPLESWGPDIALYEDRSDRSDDAVIWIPYGS